MKNIETQSSDRSQPQVYIEHQSLKMFIDRGTPAADEPPHKTSLAKTIAVIIQAATLSKARIACAPGTNPGTLLKIVRHKTEKISTDNMMRILNKAGYDVEIVVRPSANFTFGGGRTRVSVMRLI